MNNMKIKQLQLLCITIMLTAASWLTSCDSDDPVAVVPATLVTVEVPANLENAVLSDALATLVNVETLQSTTVEGSRFVKDGDTYKVIVNDLPTGTYNISLRGHLDFTINGIAGQKEVEVKRDNIEINEQSASIKLMVFSFTARGGFVISEIFFAGSTTPEGKAYSGDQYIIITNNSDVTLYADSIAVLESAFMTTDKQDYTPNIMSTDFTVQACYMIPGDGHSVPVEPGQSLTLAINAINHIDAQPNSIDLSQADYEFFDDTSNPNFTDVDGAAPNLDKWFCYTATVYHFHNRGFCSMAIAKMQTSREEWLQNNYYEATYTYIFGEYTYDRTMKNLYKVPNTWIIDGVNLSVESMYQWNVIDASIDAGWTYCGKVDKDENRFNKSVIRKRDANGKYIDTNNSTNDFIPEAPASLLNQ